MVDIKHENKNVREKSMNPTLSEVRLHLPSSVLPYEQTKNVFVEANQDRLAEEGVVVLPTPQHITKLETAVEKANSVLEQQRTGLKFVKHEKLNDYYIQIVDSKNERLQYLPIVTFVQEKEDMDYQVHDVLYPAEEEALQKVSDGFELYKEKYPTQTVRAIVMDILDACSPVAVRPSGGVYFVPEQCSKQIENLQNLVSDLNPFCLDNGKTDFRTVPVIDVDEQRDMVSQSLQEQVKTESLNFIKEISTIIQSGRKASVQTATRYVEQVQALKVKVKEYEDLLETEIDSVQATMDLAMEAAKKLLNNIEAA